MKTLLLLTFCLSIPLSLYAESIGRIIKLHGTVYKFNAQKAEKKLVKKGDFIYRQDSLETSSASIVKIIMNDETIFQLGPKSQFAFEKFKMRTKNDRDATYSLKYGQLRSLFTRKAPKRSLTIKARNVSMGIRGTEILTNVFKNTNNKFQTDIALLTGKLEIMQKINNKVKKIFIKPGFKFSTNLIAKNNLQKAVKRLPSTLFKKMKRKKTAALQSFLPLAKTANNKFNDQLIQQEQMADKEFVKPTTEKSSKKIKQQDNKRKSKYKANNKISSVRATGENKKVTTTVSREQVQMPTSGGKVKQPAKGDRKGQQSGIREQKNESSSREIRQKPVQGHRGGNSSSSTHKPTDKKGKKVIKTIKKGKPIHKGQKAAPSIKRSKKQTPSTTKPVIKHTVPKVKTIKTQSASVKAVRKKITPTVKAVPQHMVPATKTIKKQVTPTVKVIRKKTSPVIKPVVPQTKVTIDKIAKTIPKPAIQVPTRNNSTPVIRKPTTPKKPVTKKKPKLKKPKIQIKKKVRSKFRR